MNIISRLLLVYRKENSLTQRELAENLSHISTDFEALNTVTISRWETGVTKPGINKKQQLLRFLLSKGCAENKECLEMMKESYRHLQEPIEEAMSGYFKHMVGNFPQPKKSHYSISSLKDHTNKQKLLEEIIRIEDSMCAEGYYTLTSQRLDEWCSYPGSFTVLCEADGRFYGYYLLFKIKNSIAEDIAFHRKSWFSLDRDDFCDVEEKGTYWPLAFYANSPKVAALLNVQHFLYLLENSRFIDNMMIFSTRDDTVPLTKNYGIKTVASGKDKVHQVNWHGMFSPVEDILFSDTVIKAVF